MVVDVNISGYFSRVVSIDLDTIRGIFVDMMISNAVGIQEGFHILGGFVCPAAVHYNGVSIGCQFVDDGGGVWSEGDDRGKICFCDGPVKVDGND